MCATMKMNVLLLLLGASMQAQDIKPGQIYRHYKGKLYKVLVVAVDTESKWIDDPAQITDKEKRVIYQGFGEGHALSTEITWDRPYEMFAGTCEIAGKECKRFELMKERVTARTVLLNEKNQIYLLKYKMPDETFWLTPGGKIEVGETHFDTAKRELYEETGVLDAEFVLPHTYYSEAVYTIAGTPTFFREHIFIAYTREQKTNSDNHNEDEKQEIVEGKWWDLDEFIASGETFYPRGLLEELKKVVYQEVWPQGTITVRR